MHVHLYLVWKFQSWHNCLTLLLICLMRLVHLRCALWWFLDDCLHDYNVVKVKPVGIHKVIQLEPRFLVYEKGWDLEIPHPTEKHQNLFTFMYECSFDFENDAISQISEISMYNKRGLIYKTIPNWFGILGVVAHLWYQRPETAFLSFSVF